jgi:hypothetical protein
MEYQQFVNFLRKRKLYKPYLKNFFSVEQNEYGEYWIRKNIDSPITLFEHSPRQMISSGFKWDNTPEGKEYWWVINTRWLDFELNSRLIY